MRRIRNIGIFLLVFFVYRNWFLAREIIGGDWPYFTGDLLRQLPFTVPSWMAYQINGLGGPSLSYALDSYLYVIAQFFIHGIPWPIIYKISYFGLFIGLSCYSAQYFVSKLFPKSQIEKGIAVLIYTTNTFILMVAGGGQMGVALAYAAAPLMLGSSIGLIHDIQAKQSGRYLRQVITVGIFYGVVILFDARIAFLIMGAQAVYILMSSMRSVFTLGRLVLLSMIIPVIISIFLHASWIFPMIVFRFSPYQLLLTKSSGIGSFIFYSFATFSNGISLLHPNWPENIFGKVYFQRPEFFIVPILAFISFAGTFFKKDKEKQFNLLYCGLLVLLGAFLAKGAQPPFGGINIWFYTHIPGFSMFRDSTKFFVYIAIGYMVLIPFSLSYIADIGKRIFAKLMTKEKMHLITSMVIGAFLIYWFFTIRPAVIGTLGGTFQLRDIPREYLSLAEFLSPQKDFFRTLWYPRQQRFSYYTNNHPSVEANHFLGATNSAELAQRLASPSAQKIIKSSAIKYIIVPYDVYGEIFTKDRKYDDSQWRDIVRVLDGVSWITKKTTFGKLAIYEVPDYYGRFYLMHDGKVILSTIPYVTSGTTHYTVTISIQEPSMLIFSERYSPYWKASVGKNVFTSISSEEGYNSFYLPSGGIYTLDIYFSQQNVYTYGRLFSFGTVVVLFVLWTLNKKRTI